MIALAGVEARKLGLTSSVGLPEFDPSIKPIIDDMAQYSRLVVMREDQIADELRLMCLRMADWPEMGGEED